MKSRIKLWSIGGGKGGIGKSIFTLGLAISLARLGKKVVLIDGDLGGANLHTLVGVRYPQFTLEHFLLREVPRLEDIIIKTQIDGIGLVCGADDILGAANPTYSQKLRLLKQMEELPAHFVLLDLGAGTSFNVLDLFNYSPGRIALFTSQATSLQNGYGFIKSALYRKVAREFARDAEVLELLQNNEGIPAEVRLNSLRELASWLKETDPDRHARLTRVLGDFQVYLVANMVKNDSDLKSSHIIQSVCADFLGIEPQILGHLDFDPAVEAAISRMTPFPLHQQKSPAAKELHQIALKVVQESRLARSAWVPESEALEKVGLPAFQEC